jgi:hypothetical protein
MSKTVTRREFLRLMGASGVVLTACSLGSSIVGYAGVPPRRGQVDPDKYGVIILVDGLRADLFFELLESNRLPHIKEHLVDRGAMIECVDTLPSTTGPAHLPFLTGTFPGRNNVTGIRWVDRENKICRDYCAGLEGVMINKDYDLDVPTLFEVLHGEETASIYEIVNKGAAYVEIPKVKEAWWASKEKWEQFDEKAVDLLEEWYDRRLLRFAFVWMPGVDHLSHFHGPTSERVRNAMIAVDRHVGRIVDVLEKHGIYDKTLLGLVADHGLRDNGKHMELAEYLADLGLEVKEKLSVEGEWVSIHRYNAVVAVSGNAFAHVYLCDDEGKLGGSISVHDWSWEPKRPLRRHPFLHHGWKWEKEVSYDSIRRFPIGGNKRVDLVEALLAHEGVKLLLIAERWGRYLVFSSSGQSVIERLPGDRYRYSVVDGDDPLGYAGVSSTAALMDGEFHPGDEWLKASFASAHPDAVVQISQLFDSRRCGDVVVLATPGWDLMDEGHIGSHGSLEKEEMMTSAVLAGPGIVRRRLKYARTVDIFPTCLRFFGLNPAPLKIDGRMLDIFA